MNGDYHRIVTAPALDRTTSPKPPLSAAIKELQQTLDPDEATPTTNNTTFNEPSAPPQRAD